MKKLEKIFKNYKSEITVCIFNILLFIGGLITSKLFQVILALIIFDIAYLIAGKINFKKIKFPKKRTVNKNGKVNDTKLVTKDKKIKIKKPKKKTIFMVMIGFLILLIISLISMMVFIYIIIKNAPDFNPEKLYNKEATVIYDKDGKVITRIGKEIREKINYDQMPQVLVDAIVATEDSRFFAHNGFDLPRFIKASLGQALGNSSAGGASTLTMQISKNAFTSTEHRGLEGIMRKFTDIYISIFKIEKKYTKFEIIEFYANTNYLGDGSHGVEQASQGYFGKSAKDMNLAEAATIAGLFNAPTALDPTINPEGANNRKNVVLYLMERHGYITKDEQKIATDIHVSDLLVKRTASIGKYQAFINTVTEEIEKKTGNNPYVVPMDIYTTMDRAKQDHIDSIFNGDGYVWENEFVNAGVSVIDVHNGALVAIGAGRNHKNQKVFNFATMTKRQIGSTAKPLFDYAPAIENNNWSTYYPFTDEPHSYSSGTSINNWDNKFGGFMTLRESLKTSRNIPALKAFQQVPNKKIKEFVTSLGLSPEITDGIVNEAHSLGGYNGESPLSLAAAYSAFANGGYYTEPYSYTKIIYKDSGEVIEHKTVKNRVMKSETAYLITNVLLDAAKWGLYNNYPVNGVTYAAKTGTTNFSQETINAFKLSSSAINDLWIASYSADYAIAQWYGYEKINSEYYTKFGNANYRRLFQTIAKGIYTENKAFTKPNNIIEVAVEKETMPAKLPSPGTPSSMIVTELFIKGTEPTEVSERYSKLAAPTNLEASISGDKVTLTWEAVKTPNYHDLTFLTNYYNTNYKDASFASKYLNAHLSYNQSTIGEFGYQVYLKTNGELKSLGFTKDPKFTYTGTGNLTFVVKSAYSIFNLNISDGIEKTITADAPIVTSSLSGSSIVNVSIGSTFTDLAKPIVVMENGIDVTSTSVITKKIENSSGVTIPTINTSLAGTYTITYSVTYGTYTKNHVKTVIVS